MSVTRIHTDSGSHVEPPLDEDWPNLDKLRWLAALAAHDGGMDTRLVVTLNDWDVKRESFSITYDIGLTSPYSYTDAWTLLNGIAIGAEIVQRRVSGEANDGE
jgi:hypothetical protein